MSRLSYFLTPESAFEALRKAKLSEGSRLIIRRFSKDEKYAGMKTLDLDDKNNALTYMSGNYCEYYLTLGSVPLTSSDWDFTDRAKAELLVFDGGRLVQNDLEITDLRIFSKFSQAKKNFRAVKKAILDMCDKKGVVTLSGEHDPGIYLPTTLEKKYRLRFSLNKETDNFICRPS
ncbi:hypothetical protein [Gimesia sp.]|uniref:hypothetical protein n=1 Tax=Gimesia sp. TaxID=2024833 RepID=UPI003A90D618